MRDQQASPACGCVTMAALIWVVGIIAYIVISGS